MGQEFEIMASRLGRAALRILVGSLGGGLGADIFDSIVRRESGDVDKRLAKIEAARENLLEALTAIDEIKATAQEHKRELEVIRNSVVELGNENDRLAADKKLLVQMTSAERERLREMLGVPTRLQATLMWVGTFLFGSISTWFLTYAYELKVKSLFDILAKHISG